jgi:hypothetical protein
MPEDQELTPSEEAALGELFDRLTAAIRADTERLRVQVAELHAENEIRDLNRWYRLS